METIEEAIKIRLANFYDKRKASGDFRPCGSHDMVCLFIWEYLGVFGIEKRELEDKRFLGRLRRMGFLRLRGGKVRLLERMREVRRRGRGRRKGRRGSEDACRDEGKGSSENRGVP